MSGFLAIVNTDGASVDREMFATVANTLTNKGPDQKNQWISGSVGFAHSLFRTTDQDYFEKQPRHLGGRYCYIGSARIDGREELLTHLRPEAFISLAETPDSELIILAYAKWGYRALDYLIGDYAFVIWDAQNRALFAANDRFGLRKLYYAKTDNQFLVTNSIACGLAHPDISKRLNSSAVGNFLLFGDHGWGDKSNTMFAELNALPPAHTLTLQDNAITRKRYWEFPVEVPLTRYRREQEYLENFAYLLKVATADRIRSDKVAISMSGGMDSTAIAAIVNELRATRSISVQAITADFEKTMPSMERHYAEIAARHLDLPIEFLDSGNYQMLSPYIATTHPIEDYLPAFWLDWQYKVAESARVVLIGGSADNLLAYSTCSANLRETGIANALFYRWKLQKRYGQPPPLGTGILRFLHHRSRKPQLNAPPTYLIPTG